jgi:hypothetical protein
VSAYYGSKIPEPPPPQEPHFGRVIWTLLGGVIAAAFVLFLQGAGIKLTGGKMSFEVFAGVLLTAVAVIVAVFGAGLAILAFWGFSQLKKESIKASVSAARQQVDRLIREEIASPEMEQRIRHRVDEIVLGNARDRELDADLDEEGGAGA